MAQSRASRKTTAATPSTDAPAKGWAIYARVSTDEQAKEGVSLQVQKERCRSFLAAQGLPVAEVYVDEGRSGKDFKRPEIKRLFEDMHEGRIAGICIWKLDRLSRRLFDLLDLLQRLAESDVGLMSVTEAVSTTTPHGKFVLHLLGSLAELERDQISARTKAAMTYLRSLGRFVGGVIPSGLHHNKESKKLEADVEVASRLAKAWSMAASGMTNNEIARYLKTERIKTSGKGWTKGKVSNLLRNRRYIGLVVNAEDFEAAAKVMSTRANPFRPGGKRLSPQTNSDRVWRLHGVGCCGKCGSPLVGRSSTSKTGKIYPYLACNLKINDPKRCDADDLPADQWENAVIRAIVEYIQQPDLLGRLGAELAAHRANTAPKAEKREALIRARDEARLAIGRLAELVAAGDATGRAVGPTLAVHQEKLEAIEQEIATAEVEVGAGKLQETSVEFAADLLAYGAKHLLTAPVEQQAMVLKGLLSEVRMARGVPTIQVKLFIPLAKKGQKESGSPEAGEPFSQTVLLGDLDGT